MTSTRLFRLGITCNSATMALRIPLRKMASPFCAISSLTDGCSMARVASVSYTHLDVYKRQSISSVFRFSCANAMARLALKWLFPSLALGLVNAITRHG